VNKYQILPYKLADYNATQRVKGREWKTYVKICPERECIVPINVALLDPVSEEQTEIVHSNFNWLWKECGKREVGTASQRREKSFQALGESGDQAIRNKKKKKKKKKETEMMLKAMKKTMMKMKCLQNLFL